ncbi:hypothetical protein ACFUIT_36445 [Streptomyces sp. NPDC057239]|uniref:hypothetical protein n=1 Tax=Streptomyces sp. NPDC057239 TaxID=3346061 RepID=UPI00364550AF
MTERHPPQNLGQNLARDATVVNEAVHAAWEACRLLDNDITTGQLGYLSRAGQHLAALRKDSNRLARQAVDGSASSV